MIEAGKESNQVVDLLELWSVIWRSKLLVIGITLTFALLSVFYSLSLDNIFRAQTILVPADDDVNETRLSGQLNLPIGISNAAFNQRSQRVRDALAILNSREFVKNFVDKHDLAVSLLASKFDSNTRRSVIDAEKFEVESGKWLLSPDGSGPTDWEIYKAFNKILSIQEMPDSGLIYLYVDWVDPFSAAQWANWLVQDLNSTVKSADLMEANQAIEFLRNQIANTQLVDLQRVFYELIEQETRTVMLADVRDEYVLKIIDPAVVPEEKFRPSRALICIVGTLLGFIFSTIFVLFCDYIARKN